MNVHIVELASEQVDEAPQDADCEPLREMTMEEATAVAGGPGVQVRPR